MYFVKFFICYRVMSVCIICVFACLAAFYFSVSTSFGVHCVTYRHIVFQRIVDDLTRLKNDSSQRLATTSTTDCCIWYLGE